MSELTAWIKLIDYMCSVQDKQKEHFVPYDKKKKKKKAKKKKK